jgi:hypothetical protein
LNSGRFSWNNKDLNENEAM